MSIYWVEIEGRDPVQFTNWDAACEYAERVRVVYLGVRVYVRTWAV